MSTNLTLRDGPDGVKIPLWQTPTHITWMCLSLDTKGKPAGGMAGVRQRYILWVLAQLDGVWENKDDMEAMRTLIGEHVATVIAVKWPKFSYS